MNCRVVARSLFLVVLGLLAASAFGGGQGEDYGETLRQVEQAIEDKFYNEAIGELERVQREAPQYTDRTLRLLKLVWAKKAEINDLKNDLREVFEEIDAIINQEGEYADLPDADQEQLVNEKTEEAFAIIRTIGDEDPYASEEDQEALDRASADVANQQLRREAVGYYNRAEDLILQALGAAPDDTETSVGNLIQALSVYLELLEVFEDAFTVTRFPEFFAEGEGYRQDEVDLVASIASLQDDVSTRLLDLGGLDRSSDPAAVSGIRELLFGDRSTLGTFAARAAELADAVIELEGRIVDADDELFSVPYLRLAIINPLLGNGIDESEYNDGILGVAGILQGVPFQFALDRFSETAVEATDAAIQGVDPTAASQARFFAIELATVLGRNDLASTAWDDGFILAEIPDEERIYFVTADSSYRISQQVDALAVAIARFDELNAEVTAYVPEADPGYPARDELRAELAQNRENIVETALRISTAAQRLSVTLPEGYEREKGWYTQLEGIALERQQSNTEVEADLVVASASYDLQLARLGYEAVEPTVDPIAATIAGTEGVAGRNGKRPDLALSDSRASLDALTATRAALQTSLDSWRDEDGRIGERISPSIAEAEALLADTDALDTQLSDLQEESQQLVDEASAFAAEADGLLGIAQATQGRLSANVYSALEQYEVIEERLIDAAVSYQAALDRWDNDPWWNALQDIEARRIALGDNRRGLVLEAIDGLLGLGQDEFDGFNYRGALDYYQQAKDLLESALPGVERGDIDQKIALTNKAIESEKDTKIAKTDPNYNLLVGYLVSAKQDISAASTSAGQRDQLLRNAESNVAKVLDIKPNNIDAKLLQLEIQRTLDPDNFAQLFQRQVNQARGFLEPEDEDTEPDLTAAYAVYKTLNELDPANAEVAAELLELEYELGLRERPLSQAVINQSNAIRIEVQNEFNALVASANRNLIDSRVPVLIERINTALQLNPNNQAARDLFNQMLDVGTIGRPTLSPADQEQFDLAVAALNRGDIGEARFRVERLLAAGQNEANTRLLQNFLNELE
jgi:hypothetical protein